MSTLPHGWSRWGMEQRQQYALDQEEQKRRAAEAAPEAPTLNGMRILVDPTMPPNTMRLESGEHSVTMTNIDFGAPTGAAPEAPTLSDAEFLSKRLARVAKLAGVTMPSGTHEQIAEVAGTILGEIARALELAPTGAAPEAPVSEQQDRRALELANAALIASEPKQPEGWKRHEAAINATSCALNKPADTAASASDGDAADAYNHACELMEQFQAERAKRGVEIGTQGSLCDGLAWLFDRINDLEGRATASSRDAAPLEEIIATVCAKHRGTAWGNSHRQAMREVAEAAIAQQSAAQVPAAYVNGDELDNMLGDRTAAIQSEPSGWRGTPLYRRANRPKP